MTHEGPPAGTPFRESADPDAEALERMRKQIEAEGKHGVLIPKNWKIDQKIPEFTELLNKKVSPENIAFYSNAMGILRFVDKNRSTSISVYYYYSNQIKSLTLAIEKFAFKQATFFHLFE